MIHIRIRTREESEYYSRTNYLAFGVDKDVYIECRGERLPCRLHQYAPIMPSTEKHWSGDDCSCDTDTSPECENAACLLTARYNEIYDALVKAGVDPMRIRRGADQYDSNKGGEVIIK